VELDLRAYLDILKRHRWIIIEAAVVVAVVAALLTALRTPTYTATAKVLLRPNDPSETLDQTQTQRPADPDRFVSAQINIIQSQAVAAGAGTELKGGTPKELLAHLSVHQAGQNDIINISGHDVDPVRSRDIANAFAHAYIENRRQFAIGNLQQAADEIQTKLTQLQTRIAQLDARIEDGGPTTATGPAVPTAPTAGTTSPTAPTNGTAAPDTDVGALPSDQQTLIAARYAAQVQYQSLFSQQQNISVDISLKRGEAELIAEAETPTAPSSTSAKRNGALGLFVGLLLGVGIAFLREQLNDKIRSRHEAETVTGLPVIAELPLDPDTADEDDWVSAADVPLGGLAEAARTLRTSLQFLSVDEPIRRLVVTSAGPGDGKSFVAANLAVVYAQAGMRTVLVSGDVRKPRLSRMFGISRSARGLSDLLAELSALEQAAARQGTQGAANGHGNGHGNGRAFFAEEPEPEAEPARAGGWWEPTTAAPAPQLTPGSSITELPPGALSTRQQSLLRNTLVATRVPNLALLPAGAAPPNPAELLGSKRSAEVLRELSNIADIVIIDTPPVLAVTDAVILAEQADGVLLVTALGETKRSGAERAKGILSTAHTRILGLVLNKVEASESYYYGYYGDAPDSRTQLSEEPRAEKRPAPKRKLARRA
jgi:Mrp family chromosome partitioning ATPase/capsular polysaccharide biosynthesis protein